MSKKLTEEDLYEAIGTIDDDLLLRTESVKRKRKAGLRTMLPIAAAAVVLLGVALVWGMTGIRYGRSGSSPDLAFAPAAEEAIHVEEAAEEVPEEAEVFYEEDFDEVTDMGDALESVEDAKPAGTEGLYAAHAPETAEAGNAEEQAKAAGSMNDTDTEVIGMRIERMRIRISDGTNTVEYLLNDSPSARSFYEQLPMDAAVRDYGDNEKIFYPVRALDETDGIEGGGTAGGIAYFSPWGNIVLYYGDFSAYNGLYLLGEAQEGTDAVSRLSGTLHIEAVE